MLLWLPDRPKSWIGQLVFEPELLNEPAPTWPASKSELFGLSLSPGGTNPIPIPLLPNTPDPCKFMFSFIIPNIGTGLCCGGMDWRFVGENCEKLGTCCPPVAIPGTTQESCMFLIMIGSLFLLVLVLNFFDGGGRPKWAWL